MRSTVERFAQILVVVWSLAVLESADGASVTWYEPLPVKTVSSAPDDLTPAETKLFEGYPASLSWNFSLTSVTLFSVSIQFNTDKLAFSGPGGAGAQVRDAFKDKFNFTWISQRLTLVIFNVTGAYDERKGKFSCELTAAEGEWIRKIQVKVLKRPQVVGVTRDQDVCEHSEVTLSCNATGKPEPNITWTRVWENGTDSGALQSKDGYLVMANISGNSNGTYRCTAFNGVGEPVNQTVKVIIRHPPTAEQVPSITVKEGEHVTWECKAAAGTPPLNEFWKIVKTSEIIPGKLLNITNIRRNQRGEYKCFANNTCGNDSSTMFIDVQFKPDNVTLERNTTENNGCKDLWVNFTCNSSEANPPVHNYALIKNETEFIFSRKGTWIEKISRGETFVYKCQAYQQVDNVTSTNDITLNINDPPTAEQVPSITVKEGGHVTSECKAAAGTPPPDEFWKIVKTSEIIPGKLLNITNIRRNQRGEYKCFANNTCGNDSSTMSIDVQFKPDNVTLERNTTENNGCNDLWVNFTCNSSEANPPVHNYALIKNETEFIFSRKGTWIEKISRGETFVYKCQAYQQVDNVTSTDDITLNVNDPPTAEQVPSIKVKEGGHVTRECKAAAGTPPPNVFWKIVKTSEIIPGKLLNITNIRRNQSGEYKCFANNTCGNDSSTMFIDVQYRPNITHVMNNITVKDGDTVTLDCQADGNPRPTIRWIFNNSSYVPGLFSITGKHNEGCYRCIAENSVGRDESTRDVCLTVFYYRPVNPTLIINTGDSSVILNQTFTITCDAKANPPAEYEIFRDDGNKVGSNSVVTTSVTEVEWSNSVTFTCKASNTYGDGPTVKITLEVHYAAKKTKEPSKCPEYVQKGREIKLECHVEGNPPPNITWAVGGEPIDSDLSNNSYTPRATGVFDCTCSACNGIGECVNLTLHRSADSFLAKKFLLMMVEQDLTLNADLNNDQSDEYKKKDKEVKRKVKEALSTCDKHSTSQIILRPHGKSTKIYFHLLFVKLMGKSALLDALQKATQKDGPLANFNSITLEVSDIPAKKNCSSFYVDDQICEKVKLAWVIFFICLGVILVVVIFIVCYCLHKKRNCKDQRVGNCENEDQLALPSNHSTLSEGNRYAGENGGYANSGPLLAVKVVSEQELGAASVDSENTYAKVDKSKKKDKKKDKKAADEKPTEDQYAVVDKSKKKIKKNEPDATYAEVDMSKKSKKKPKPGEVLYADLSEFQEMQKMPEVSTSPKTLPPIKLPEAYAETQYADITQFLKANPEDKRAEPPKESTTSTVSNIATGNKEESSAGNAGDGAETTNETGF